MTSTSSYVTSPTSPTQRFAVFESNQNRQGFRNPHAQMSLRMAVPVAGARVVASVPHVLPHAVTSGALTSGLSSGIEPSRLTLKIFPFGTVRHVAKKFVGVYTGSGALFELHPVSPSPM